MPAKVAKRSSSSDDLNTYLGFFPKRKLLTREEEINAGRVLRNEDSAEEDKENASNCLLLSNTKLVVAEAVKFHRRAPVGFPIVDLISEGLFGLFDAIKRFDPERPCKFSTYATWWIRRYIRKALAGSRMIRIPYYMNGIISRMPWVYAKLIFELNREPSDEELSKAMEISISDLTRTNDINSSTKVFSAPSDSSDGNPMNLVIDTSDQVKEGEFNRSNTIVWEVLNSMEKTEAFILMMRFGMLPDQEGGKKFTFKEIGRVLLMSREKARKMGRVAMDSFLSKYIDIKSKVGSV